MSDVLYKVTKYMNVEDALLAREEKPKKRERQEDVWQDRGWKIARTGEWWEDRRSKPPTRKVHELHPADYPDQPSLDANQRRRSLDIS